MEKFKRLGISEQLLKSIQESGFEAPREIQEKAIPLALAGNDIIGGSVTGSGKTLAFGAGVIDKTIKGEGIQALILTPTRELAEQVARALRIFSRHKELSISVVYGGVAMSPQVESLKKADIVVGTPGRILDHLRHDTLDLSSVRFLVLDEADRMLDMGFIDDVETIIKHCPEKRQTFLFSATISSDILHIAKKYMKDPVDICGEECVVDPSKLRQIFYDVPSNQKFSLLVHLLKEEYTGLVMIFCNTRHNADFVAHNLKKNNIDAIAIHGGLAQSKRMKIMELFKSNRVHALVCTDVAARGLDIPGVSHVYNYDSPKNSKEYIHRIGRTARAGKDGIAISIVSSRDYENFNAVLKDSSIIVKQEQLPENIGRAFMQINIRRERGRGFGGRGSGRFGSRGGGFNRRGEGRERHERGGRSRFGGRDRGREGGRRPFGGRGRDFNRRDDRSRDRRGFGRGRRY